MNFDSRGRGFVVLSVLLLLFFAALMSCGAALHAERMLRMLAAEAAAARIRSEVMQDLPAAAPADGAAWCCARTKRGRAGLELERSLCGLCAPSEAPALPAAPDRLIHYNALFLTGDAGPVTAPAAPPAVLNPSAALSAATCHLDSRPALMRFVVRTNLEGRSGVDLRPADSGREHALLAAAGYIHLAGAAAVHGPALIVAGGDLIIDRLVASAGLPEVTVISATGMVKIGEVQGEARLRAVAPLGAYLPCDYESGSLLPAGLPLLPLALAAGHSDR